jgi:cytochrome c-type biogenesis protein CcmH/NrfG
MIKKETMYIAVIIALVTGFIGGVIFSALQTTPDMPQPTQQGPAPTSDGHDHTKEQDAISALEDIVKEHPEEYEAWVSLGHNYFDTHQHEKAIHAYDRALSINNSDANVWTDMRIMYRRSKNPEKAIECFAEATNRDPNHLIALFNTGLVNLVDLQNVDAAIAAWEKAVAVNPGATTPDGKSLKLWLEELQKTIEK